jgi:hypothetical protein
LIPLRVFGAACGHFMARYFRAKAYLVIEAAFRPSSRAPCLRVELFAGVGGTEQLGPVVVHKPFVRDCWRTRSRLYVKIIN